MTAVQISQAQIDAVSAAESVVTYAVIDTEGKKGDDVRTYQVTTRNADALDSKSVAFAKGIETRKGAAAFIAEHKFVRVANFRQAKELELAKLGLGVQLTLDDATDDAATTDDDAQLSFDDAQNVA